jgi:sarcosine oxidase subunit delta
VKIIDCPLNGPRNAQEFVCGGEVKLQPSAPDADARAWADYIFMEENPKGMVREWWCHVASGYWFIAERDTATDSITRSYPAHELFDQAGGEDS